MTILAYGIFLLSEIIRNRRYFLAVSYTVFSVLIAFYLGFFNFTVPFSNYTLPEPSLYVMLFIFSCPILMFLLLFTKLKTRFDIFFILLILITPFTQGGRGLPFMHIFLAPYVLSGYKNVRKLLPSVEIVDYVFALMILLWFCYFFGYMAHNMTLEFVFRGLDVNKLGELGFYIPLSH
jgi:hypothetical protein